MGQFRRGGALARGKCVEERRKFRTGSLPGAGVAALALTLTSMSDGSEAGPLADKLEILRHMSIVYLDDGHGGVAKTIRFDGVNVQIVNGLGATNGNPENPGGIEHAVTNGLGNLIVGYNETGGLVDDHTGSHNLVAGYRCSYSGFGGLVAGSNNSSAGPFTVAAGGFNNEASGIYASALGGSGNRATGYSSLTAGGLSNEAIGFESVTVGGNANDATGERALAVGGDFDAASGERAVVVGGWTNEASGTRACVAGGQGNQASGSVSSVSGPFVGTASGTAATVSGGYGNTAAGFTATVSGGWQNQALGDQSTVGGGYQRTAAGEKDWVAETLFEDE